tara:strand:+ start:1678 stop:2289 length:612 start_codon:yes stop_codon:yes gene_type:complete
METTTITNVIPHTETTIDEPLFISDDVDVIVTTDVLKSCKLTAFELDNTLLATEQRSMRLSHFIQLSSLDPKIRLRIAIHLLPRKWTITWSLWCAVKTIEYTKLNIIILQPQSILTSIEQAIGVATNYEKPCSFSELKNITKIAKNPTTPKTLRFAILSLDPETHTKECTRLAIESFSIQYGYEHALNFLSNCLTNNVLPVAI